MNILFSGLVFGMCFGFLLQKSRMVRYDKQLGVLRFMDMTIVKFMFSAILAGMVGINIMQDMGLAKPLILPMIIVPNIVGGLMFGIGWGLFGY